jgi:hypothetical protein
VHTDTLYSTIVTVASEFSNVPSLLYLSNSSGLFNGNRAGIRSSGQVLFPFCSNFRALLFGHVNVFAQKEVGVWEKKGNSIAGQRHAKDNMLTVTHLET